MFRLHRGRRPLVTVSANNDFLLNLPYRVAYYMENRFSFFKMCSVDRGRRSSLSLR